MTLPSLSVVIPTHNRCGILPRTLGALATQTAAATDYEVIVVADGCRDETAVVVRSLPLPYAVRVIEQPASGAAAARNRGAAAAVAPLVLFLDDDMEAEPQLIASHLQAHRAHPGGVVLGYFRPSMLGRTDHLPTVMVNLWWAERFAEMARPEYRFTFYDLYTGNVSLPRALFDTAGGFEEDFFQRAGEDYELGARLMKRRVRFRFVRDAASVHHDLPTADRSFRRAFAEGRGHVLLARKHPDLFAALPLRWLLSDPPPPGLRPLFRPGSWVGAVTSHALQLPLRLAETLKLRRVWAGLHGLLHNRAYWRGAVEELGSWSNLQRFIQEMPLHPDPINELELDVATQWPALEAILTDRHVDALRLRYGDAALGRIPPVPGAEPLRPAHVHHALAHWFGYNLLTAVRQRELEETANNRTPGLLRVVHTLGAGWPLGE